MFVFLNLVTYCLFICCVFGKCCSEEEKGSRNGSKVGDGSFRRLVKDCFGVRNEDVLLGIQLIGCLIIQEMLLQRCLVW